MSNNPRVVALKKFLFSSEHNVYAVIDGAACPDLRFKIYDWEPKSHCLWRGELAPDMQEVAPYLVQLEQTSSFTDWLLEKGWANNWNIFVESPLEDDVFQQQIRKLLTVESPEGKPLMFRFYDPRVLKMYTETMTNEQAPDFFAGVLRFIYPIEHLAQAAIAQYNEIEQSVEFSIHDLVEEE